MSTHYVDDTVVSMKFDNRDFERNVHQSLGTIDKLKKSLDFKGAADSMEQLSDTVEKTDLSPLLKGLSKATDGFSALEVMAITALSRITNKAMDVGEKLVKSLTVDQLAAGWNKYEQKISAVQTIMAATSNTWRETADRLHYNGTQMEFVNEQLEKLNWFSDETSYSFTDMTSNIGKFTSAGVELDKAVTAMEGISVWAAKSGVNAQNATRAYYNLAQAISVGAVKQIDWKSIENVNMATMEFKQTAIDMAVKMGTLKKASKDTFKTLKGGEVSVKNFNDRLKDEWFTTDVLTATLEEYGKAATRLSEIYDNYGIYATEFLGGLEDWTEGNRDIIGIADDLGVSVETLLPLFQELSSEEYALSLSAFKAAQEAKTFTEVLEATKDAVSTQWMNTWELIFGNYEEAKKLWSEMAEKFFEIFAGGGEKRNSMLKNLLGDSWDLLIKRIEDAGVAADVFEKKVLDVMERAGLPVQEMLDTWGSLEDIIKNNSFLMKYVRQAIIELVSPVNEGGEAIGEATKKLEDFQKVVNEVIRGEFKSGKQRVENLTKAGWNYAEVQDLVNKVWARNGQTWKDTTITAEDLVDTLGKMNKEELKTIGFTEEEVSLLQNLQDELDDTDSSLNFFLDSLSDSSYKSGRTLIFESLINIVDAFARVIEVVKDAWDDVFPNKNLKTLRRYLEIIHSITEWLVMNDETYDKIKRTLRGVFSIMGLIQDLITTVLRVLLPDIFAGTEKVGGGILDVTASLGDALYAIRQFISGGDLLKNIIIYLRNMFFASAEAVAAFIEYLSELPVVGAILGTIADSIETIVGFFKELWDIFYDAIIEENKTVFEALVKVFERLSDAFKHLEEKYPILKDIREALAEFFDAFKSYGADILDGLIEGFSGFKLDELKKKIVELAETIYNTFADWMGIHSPSTKFIELAMNCIAGFLVGLIEGTIYVVNAIRNFARGVSDTTDKYLADNPDSPMAKLTNYIKIALEGIKDFFIDIFEGVQRIIQGIGTKLQDSGILKRLSDILKQMMLILWFASVIYANVGITRAIGKIGEAFEGIGDFFESWGLKNYATIARNVAIAIVAIGGIAYLLAKLDTAEFQQAMIAIGVLTALTLGLGVLFAALTKFNQKVSKAGGEKKSKGEKIKSATSKLQTAALILSIGGAIWLVVDSVKKVQDMIGPDGYETFLHSITWIGILFGAFIAGLGIINMLMKDANKASLLGAAAVIIAISAAMGLIFDTIWRYFFNDGLLNKKITLDENTIGTFIGAITSMILLIEAMSIGVGLMSRIGGKVNMMIGVGTTLIGMGIALSLITSAISSMTESLLTLSDDHGSSAVLGAGVISLVVIGGLLLGLFAGLTYLAKVMKDNVTGVFGLLAATAFIAVLNLAVYSLVICLETTDDILSKAKNPIASIAIVAAALIGVVLAVKAINDTHLEAKSAIWTLLGMASVIAVLGYAMYELLSLPNVSSTDFAWVAGSIGVSVGVMLTLLGVCNYLSKEGYDIKKTVEKIVQLAELAGIIGVFGYAVYELTKLERSDEVVDIIKQMTWFMGILLGLASVMMIINGKMGNNSGYAVAAMIASLGIAIGVIGEGMAKLISALTGEDWGEKLGWTFAFLAGLIVLLGLFVGIVPQVLKGSEGTVGAVAGVVAAIALLVLAIAALLAAITYFVEHETLTHMFKTVYDWIVDIVNWIQKAIDKLAEFFGLRDSQGDYNILSGIYTTSDGKTTSTNASTVFLIAASESTEKEKEQKQKEKDKQLVESGYLNPNRPGTRPVGPNDIPDNVTSKIVGSINGKDLTIITYDGFSIKPKAAPVPNLQYGGKDFPKETSTANKYFEQAVNVGKEINKTLGKYGSQMYLAGASGNNEGIFGWPDKIKSIENFVDIANEAKEAGLIDPNVAKQLITDFKNGSFSEESLKAIQDISGIFGMDFGEGFANGFSLNYEDMMKKMFGGQTYEEYMKSFGNYGGYLYGQNFMYGFMTAEDETKAEAIDKASNVVTGVLSKVLGYDSYHGTDFSGFLSSQANYDLFSGYGYGGFGMQTVEFPDKMEVTSQSLETFIGNQMNSLRGQINTLKNDISNIYVRLDGKAIVGNLAPSISKEIYGMVLQYGRGN